MDKYQEIKEAFELLRDNDNAGRMSAYMRNKFKFYGIAAPLRKSAYKTFILEEKKGKSINWIFLDKCWDDEHREFQYLVQDYLKNMQKFLKYEDVPSIERYVRTKQWWDTIDGLDRIIGNIAFNDNRINGWHSGLLMKISGYVELPLIISYAEKWIQTWNCWKRSLSIISAAANFSLTRQLAGAYGTIPNIIRNG